jgi:hypothetical protein
MVFGSLFKPKGKLVLQAQDISLPGELVPLDIRVTAEEEIKPNAVRAELVGEERYFKTEMRGDGKGHSRPHTVEKNETFTRIVQLVAEQPDLSQGMEHKWNSSVQLPADAPCTCRGKLVNIRWTLKAILDVPKRADLSQEKPLHVFCRPPGGATPVPTAEKTFGEVSLSLKAPAGAVAGTSLKGQLTLQITDKLTIRSIRIELVQVEVAGTRREDTVVATAQVSGETAFSPLESPSFSFSLPIPADALPTSVCTHSSLRWKVKAVIDRKMKSDFNVEQELQVFNSSRA